MKKIGSLSQVFPKKKQTQNLFWRDIFLMETLILLLIRKDCSAITIQPNQKILITGYKMQNEKNSDFILARIHPDGKIDKSFGDQGYTITDFEGGIDVGHGIATLSSGEIVIGGEAEELFEDGSSLRHFALARYLTNGKLNFRFGNQGKILTRFGNKN